MDASNYCFISDTTTACYLASMCLWSLEAQSSESSLVTSSFRSSTLFSQIELPKSYLLSFSFYSFNILFSSTSIFICSLSLFLVSTKVKSFCFSLRSRCSFLILSLQSWCNHWIFDLRLWMTWSFWLESYDLTSMEQLLREPTSSFLLF